MTTSVGYAVLTARVVVALVGMVMVFAVLVGLLIPAAARAEVDSPIRVSENVCPLSNLA